MIVVDMEMPKNCVECRLADNNNSDECPIYAIYKSNYTDRRFENCPIKAELPAKHGRLIDADELKTAFPRKENGTDVKIHSVRMTINHMPTVIEAEGEA